MAKFQNATKVPQGFYLPSEANNWENNRTLQPGEIIETDVDADVKYLRRLVGVRQNVTGEKGRTGAGPLIEIEG